MKIKPAELEGAPLDWAAGKAGGHTVHVVEFGSIFRKGYLWPLVGNRRYSPSTYWEQGGPIIERERISLDVDGWAWASTRNALSSTTRGFGPTPLVAAMRCFVAFKLGDEVEVPDELVQR